MQHLMLEHALMETNDTDNLRIQLAAGAAIF